LKLPATPQAVSTVYTHLRKKGKCAIPRVKTKPFRQLNAGQLSYIDTAMISYFMVIASHRIVAASLSNPDILIEKGDVITETFADALLRGHQK
jgi:hypothetical protein